MHHAYLIEGDGDEIIPEVLAFLQGLGVATLGNVDVRQIRLDTFKIEDARNVKSYVSQRGISAGKRIFIISVNNILYEAQNSLLKIFEEPAEDTHFFLIMPDTGGLLKTFISRFYIINSEQGLETEAKNAEKFIKMPLQSRLDFIKDLLAEEEAPTPEGVGVPTFDESQNVGKDGPRAKALKFLNALESNLHQKTMSRMPLDTEFFNHFFKVREFLRMPGSSAKTLMESVALVTPNL